MDSQQSQKFNWIELLKGLLVAFLSVMLSLTAVEFYLRQTSPELNEPLWWQQLQRQISMPYHQPNRIVTWEQEDFVAYAEINEVGLYDTYRPYERTENTCRILIIGDSFTEAVHVPFEDAFGRRLEQLYLADNYRIEVITAGFGGTGTDRQFIWYREEGARYQPDYVLNAIFLGNDIFDNYRYFQAGQDHQFETNSYFEIQDGNLVEVQPDSQPSELDVWLINNFQTYRRFFYTIEPPARTWAVPETSPSDAPRIGIYEQAHTIIRGVNYSHVEQAKMITEAIIGRFNETVAQNGSIYIPILIPDKYQTSSELFTERITATGFEPSDFDRDLLRDWALDFLPDNTIDLFDPIANDSRQLYFQNDSHWNSTGHEVAALAIYENLLAMDVCTT